MEAAPEQNPLDVKGRHMPPAPRLVLGGVVILPLVNDDWQAVKDRWVLPGRRIVNTKEVEFLAERNGWQLTQVH